MNGNEVVSGYLDVKISARSRRGFTPWKAWQKQWCEIKRLDCIENGVELKLKSSSDGNLLNCVVLPRSSRICRTESRTKQYAFGVFTTGRNHKPLLYLSGSSESDSQAWMTSIRKMLCIATYLPVGESNFHVSLVDNVHSRTAGLMGLYGVLGTNSQDIYISDPCTGDHKITWKWYQFHQFHLQATTHASDEKMICVMHTSAEFPSGPGQLYMYCKEAPKLLDYLVARGKRPKMHACSGLLLSRRLSRSEGDLCEPSNKDQCAPDSPMCFRSQTGSDDSGVRVSLTSDDSGYQLKSKNAMSLASLGIALMTKTPGGSETNDSCQDLTNIDANLDRTNLPRRESGVSLASGIYEEIIDDPHRMKPTDLPHHVYENPIDIILHERTGISFKPPPLPPRHKLFDAIFTETSTSYLPFKQRCNTLPAKDLSRISQIFTSSDSDYMIMSPCKSNPVDKKAVIGENLYMPMSPIVNNLKSKIENCYMVMSGKKT